MRVPKQLDKCDHPESRWLRLFNLVASDLKSGIDSCQCCIFWRGFFFACLFFLAPGILLGLGWYAAAAWMFAVQFASTLLASAFFGDPLK